MAAGGGEHPLGEEHADRGVAAADHQAQREVGHTACRPAADSRMAATPQVGASTQEIGRTQSGSSAIGTRKPQISQTGTSNAVPSAHAVR